MKKKRERQKERRKKERKKKKGKIKEKKKKEKRKKGRTKKQHPTCIPLCPLLNKRTSDRSNSHPNFPPRKKVGNAIKVISIKKKISSKLCGP